MFPDINDETYRIRNYVSQFGAYRLFLSTNFDFLHNLWVGIWTEPLFAMTLDHHGSESENIVT